MNKVILMGRLTRDAEVRYSQGRVPVRLQDLHWQLTVGSAGTMRIRQRISLVVLHLARQQSFWEIWPQGNQVRSRGSYPDRQLYKQGWTARLHHRCCGRERRVCGEQKCSRWKC